MGKDWILKVWFLCCCNLHHLIFLNVKDDENKHLKKEISFLFHVRRIEMISCTTCKMLPEIYLVNGVLSQTFWSFFVLFCANERVYGFIVVYHIVSRRVSSWFTTTMHKTIILTLITRVRPWILDRMEGGKRSRRCS